MLSMSCCVLLPLLYFEQSTVSGPDFGVDVKFSIEIDLRTRFGLFLFYLR